MYGRGVFLPVLGVNSGVQLSAGAQSTSRPLTLTLAVIVLMSLGASLALAQVPVINNPLVPEQKAPGSATFTLTVNGSQELVEPA